MPSVIANVKVKEDKIEEAKKFLKELSEETLANESGTLVYSVHQRTDDLGEMRGNSPCPVSVSEISPPSYLPWQPPLSSRRWGPTSPGRHPFPYASAFGS